MWYKRRRKKKKEKKPSKCNKDLFQLIFCIWENKTDLFQLIFSISPFPPTPTFVYLESPAGEFQDYRHKLGWVLKTVRDSAVTGWSRVRSFESRFRQQLSPSPFSLVSGRLVQHPFSRMRLEKQGPVQCVVGVRTFKIYDNAEPISWVKILWKFHQAGSSTSTCWLLSGKHNVFQVIIKLSCPAGWAGLAQRKGVKLVSWKISVDSASVLLSLPKLWTK